MREFLDELISPHVEEKAKMYFNVFMYYSYGRTPDEGLYLVDKVSDLMESCLDDEL